MAENTKVLEKILNCALSGKGAHVPCKDAFAGLDWKAAGAGIPDAPHTVFELLNHMVYWQDWAIQWLGGERPAIPRHAAGSWPGAAAPGSRKEWERAVRRFRAGLAELAWRSRKPEFSKHAGKTPPEMLQTIAAHNSYHVGQAVMLRQMLGAWPPPSGGLTW